MTMMQLPTGRIIDDDHLTRLDRPEPKHRPLIGSSYIEGDPEYHWVETKHGRQLMRVRKVSTTRSYADWTELVTEPATALSPEPTVAAIAFESRHHRGGTWGETWWELAE